MDAARKDTGSRIRPLTVYKALLERGEEEFQRVIAFPILLCKASAATSDRELDETTAGFHRVNEADAHLVLELRSAAGAPGVTIGRSDSADLVVAESSVSRIHARFQLANGEWTVQDLDSRNGSYLGPIRLPPNHPEHVFDRAKLQFGNVHAFFLTPASFIRFLRQGTTAPG